MAFNLTRQNKGDLFLFSEAAIWSLFPIITILSLSTIPTLFSMASIYLTASIFFLAIIVYKKLWHELIHVRSMKDTLLATFFISILAYFFFFFGLNFTTAGNASILILMEVFFAFLILGIILKKEPIIRSNILGALFMVTGAGLILYEGELSIDMGGLLIIIGTIFTPIGTMFMQRARKNISPISILFVRNFVSSFILFIAAYYLNDMPSLLEWHTALPFLIINGILIFGISKVLWIEAIHRIPITRALSLSTMTPAFTLLFAYFILREIPTLWQIFGFLPLAIGAVMIIRKK